ncbi:hypothetical protein [Sulfuricurvum sp.]|uniref:hypothetical protein n=1 Tax=Sulfuricurvum sp. TaxID=2025608 RepID=UPI0026249470|nr:hypothetical protein [Sulfuricurvum sp.]MDD2266829.1 hypothetical protein [Sulfuricurvum sp.]MDD2784817.1 hypothetical protein [Sulfuricurvum sp.]HZF70010.1 hypothetical protein [Sulfuricurvum sp.]
MSTFSSDGRLLTDIGEIDQYRRILDKDNVKSGEPHWASMGKNTITLFQVLIDQDLTHLVMVLRHYPKYIEAVCEHFRYAYSYSENSANIDAASELLEMGEPYFTRQFVRNVMRKLPRIESDDRDALQTFIDQINENQHRWHPIITMHYRSMIKQVINQSLLHPLQRIVLEKKIASIQEVLTYDYEASDRDSNLDIPYMN